VRARRFGVGVIGWQFYSGGWGLVNLEMQPGRSRSVQWYRGERLDTAQKYRIENVFLFVVNKSDFFTFVHLCRIEMALCASLDRRGAGAKLRQELAIDLGR
jgi:hypothetical protein